MHKLQEPKEADEVQQEQLQADLLRYAQLAPEALDVLHDEFEVIEQGCQVATQVFKVRPPDGGRLWCCQLSVRAPESLEARSFE